MNTYYAICVFFMIISLYESIDMIDGGSYRINELMGVQVDLERSQFWDRDGSRRFNRNRSFSRTSQCVGKGDMVILLDSGWSVSEEQFEHYQHVAKKIIEMKCIDPGYEDLIMFNWGASITIPAETYLPSQSSDITMNSLLTRQKRNKRNVTEINEKLGVLVDDLPKLDNGETTYMINFEYPLDEIYNKLATKSSASNKYLIILSDGDFGVNYTTYNQVLTNLLQINNFIPIIVAFKDPNSQISSSLVTSIDQGMNTQRLTNLNAYMSLVECTDITICPNIHMTDYDQTALDTLLATLKTKFTSYDESS